MYQVSLLEKGIKRRIIQFDLLFFGISYYTLFV